MLVNKLNESVNKVPVVVKVVAFVLLFLTTKSKSTSRTVTVGLTEESFPRNVTSVGIK